MLENQTLELSTSDFQTQPSNPLYAESVTEETSTHLLRKWLLWANNTFHIYFLCHDCELSDQVILIKLASKYCLVNLHEAGSCDLQDSFLSFLIKFHFNILSRM